MQQEKLNLTRTPIQLFSKRLTHIKYSQLIINDLLDNKDVGNFHEKKRYLLESYIINLVASWQVFIEELLKFGLDKIIEKTNLSPVAIKILESNYDINIKRFNTPNTSNIDQTFKTVLGIEKITNDINISGMQLDALKSKVNQLLEIRHKIAHTGNSGQELEIETNFDFMKHLMTVGEQLEDIVIRKI